MSTSRRRISSPAARLRSALRKRQHDDVFGVYGVYGVSGVVSGRLAVLGLAVVVASMLVTGSAGAEPVYFGAAARGGVDPKVAQKLRAALESAVSRQGVKVLDATASNEDAAVAAMEAAKEALDDATKAFTDEDWAAALTNSLVALQKFEKELAYSEDEAAWTLYRDVMSLRALVYLKIRKRDDAADTMRALLAVMPRYAPNRDKAPENLVRLVDDTLDEIRALPPAPLEVQSKPAGAQVLVDGRRAGKTPLLLEDLVPGVHYVALISGSGRHVERVVVDEVGARVSARIGSKKGVAARDVLRALEKPTSAKVFVLSVQDVEDDGLVAVILPSGKKAEVLGARVRGGEVKVVCGIRVADNDNDRDRATFVLVEGLLERNDDAWLDQEAKRGDPSVLRQHLFAGMGTHEIPEDEVEAEPISPAVLAATIASTALAVVITGAVVGLSVSRELKKDEGFTWGVDTSGLVGSSSNAAD